MIHLSKAEWTDRQKRHSDRVGALISGHIERASRGEKHPVEDFLFTYYSFKPSHMLRWHPGAYVSLAMGEQALPDYYQRFYSTSDLNGISSVSVDLDAFMQEKSDTVRYIRDLLTATANRQPHLGCFGLHEWAMVHKLKQSEIRHEKWPLRLGEEATNQVVENHKIRCSHFDAYRFFTDSSRQLNLLQPERKSMANFEQPGCIHATMDLYKWAYKLLPATSSELVVDCFELAIKARTIDMRASPYDFSRLGYEPIAIETPEGKTDYIQYQRELAHDGQMLRHKLLEVCRTILDLNVDAGQR